MFPLDLIDQILNRTPFSCTEKQMRFLRDLVVQHQDVGVYRLATQKRDRLLLGVLRREVTVAQKDFEAALKALSDAEKEFLRSQILS